MSELTGKVVVVTGAARGIGWACTEAFLDAGATVVGVDRAWEGAEEARATLEDHATSAITSFDITRPEEVRAAAADVLGRFGAVDVLVNNVGLRQKELYPPSGAVTVLDSTNADWEAMFGVNVLGTLNVTRAFAPAMISERRGSIINIGSRDNPRIRNQPYAASKAALTSLSRYLAEELREFNVAVNVLFPSGTMTTGSAEMVSANRAQGIPMARLLRPAHVVPLALHLAAQDAAGETGQAIAAMDWNQEHGLGGPEQWVAEPG
ncbi:MAG: SDR family oxidoreductase [Acidimicrobiaceae bacterium]|nr:SDR family oxidoreductase [Acidimicrobiaceae bacterium]